MYKVLFVCMGNICRSPAGENIFRQVVAAADLADRIACDSAGTLDYHTGNPPDARMGAVLRQRGIPTSGRARQIRPSDFEDFDLILTMDEDNRRNVLALAHSPAHRDKVRPFTSYCQKHDTPEVPDPYYGGPEGFDHVADLLEDGCAGLLAFVQRQLP